MELEFIGLVVGLFFLAAVLGTDQRRFARVPRRRTPH
jgi:hypothetical protein